MRVTDTITVLEINDFRERVEEWCRKNKVSWIVLAKRRMGIAHQTLAQYMNGRRKGMTVDTLKNLSTAMDVPLSYWSGQYKAPGPRIVIRERIRRQLAQDIERCRQTARNLYGGT